MNSFIKETINNIKELGPVLEGLNIGRSFRIFGGFGLLISLAGNNTLALKIAILTFTFGAISKIIEMLNKLWPKNTIIQAILWSLFVTVYSWLAYMLTGVI